MLTHTFKIKRKDKEIYRDVPLIFGVSGVARCGKDTLVKHLEKKFTKARKYPASIVSFASAVKKDLDPFLKEKLNISAFTQKTKEKNIIRPLLVCYATEVVRNKIDKSYWIKQIQNRVESNIKNNIITLIPDVRYENEVKWIKSIGGYIIHLQRDGNKPANFEEKSNDPIIKKIANYHIRWKNFTDEAKTCSYHIAKLFKENNWSIYGEFK